MCARKEVEPCIKIHVFIKHAYVTIPRTIQPE